MTTPSADPSASGGRSWQKLTARARDEMPPEVEVRAGIRAAVESAPPREANRAEPAPDLWDDLLAAARLRWMRGALAGGAVAAMALLVSGMKAVRDIDQLAQFAGPLFAGL